jgi:transcriptional regulator with XRE-family HTH domain
MCVLVHTARSRASALVGTLPTPVVADATGLTQQRISTLEAGKLDPTYKLLLALAKELGVQPAALVTCAETPESAE